MRIRLGPYVAATTAVVAATTLSAPSASAAFMECGDFSYRQGSTRFHVSDLKANEFTCHEARVAVKLVEWRGPLKKNPGVTKAKEFIGPRHTLFRCFAKSNVALHVGKAHCYRGYPEEGRVVALRWLVEAR